MQKVILTDTFRTDFNKMPAEQQSKIKKAMLQLENTPFSHPIKGTPLRECEVSPDIVIIYELQDHLLILHSVGPKE